MDWDWDRDPWGQTAGGAGGAEAETETTQQTWRTFKNTVRTVGSDLTAEFRPDQSGSDLQERPPSWFRHCVNQDQASCWKQQTDRPIGLRAAQRNVLVYILCKIKHIIVHIIIIIIVIVIIVVTSSIYS